MDWLSNIFNFFANPTRLAWLSIAITIVVAIISVKITNRFAHKLTLTNPEVMTRPREESDDLLDQARKLMGASRLRSIAPFGKVSKEHLEQALIAILKAVAISPRYARAHYEHGVYELVSRQPGRALPHMKKATALEPKNARYQCALGQAFWESARSMYLNDGVAMGRGLFARPWAKAKLIARHFRSRRCFAKAVKLDPNLYIARIRLGTVLRQRSKERAQIHFESALKLEPDNETPYLMLIRLFFDHDDLADARIIAKKALKKHPDNLSFIKQLKKIYAAESNFEKLKELENLHPTHSGRSTNSQHGHSPMTTTYRPLHSGSVYAIGAHPVVRNLRQYDKLVDTAVEHLLNEKIDDARDEFKSLSSKYPAEPMYKLALADCALQSADYELAATLLSDATPGAQTDWYWRSICFSIAYMQQDYTRASELAKSWWDADNNNIRALCMYCDALHAKNEPGVMLETLNNVVASQKLENSELLSIAEFYICANKPRQAESLLQRALESDPKDYETHLAFCRLYLNQEHYSQMSDYAASALALGAERSVCLFYRAVGLANAGKTDAAITLFLQCIELTRKNPSYYLHLGYAYTERFSYPLAENALKTATRLSPNWNQPLHALGELYVEMHDIVSATETYQHLIQIKPSDSLAYARLAFCYESATQKDRAIEHYKRAIELGDHHHVTYFNLGHLYEDESRRLARECYEKALAILPTYSPALFNIGIQYMHRNRHEQSLPYFEKALEHDPDNTAYEERLAMAYHDAKRYNSCIALAHKIVAKDPENFMGWDCLGRSYVAQKDIQAALNAFATAARLSVNRRVEFLNRIGNIHLELGDSDAALKCYTETTKAYPNDGAAYMNIGKVHFMRNDENEALKWYRVASEKSPGYATPYFNRALIYNNREQYDLALGQLDTAIGLDHNFASALNLKGAILMEDKHDLTSAKAAYEQCVKVSPHNTLALTRLAHIHNQLHDHEQALFYANQAIDVQADNTDAYEHLIAAYDALERVEDGKRARAQLKQLEKQDKSPVHEPTVTNTLV